MVIDINLEQEKLGELLVEREVLSREQLDHALEVQENVGAKLEEILIKLDLVTEEELIEAVADQQNMEVVDLSNLILPQDLIDEVPKEVIEEHEVIPIGLIGDNLRLAIHDPFDIESIEEVGLATDYHIEPVLTSRESILKAIADLFYDGSEFRPEDGLEVTEEEQDISREQLETQFDVESQDVSVVLQRLVDLLIRKGVVTTRELNTVTSEEE